MNFINTYFLQYETENICYLAVDSLHHSFGDEPGRRVLVERQAYG
jgi:hypothetical protein